MGTLESNPLDSLILKPWTDEATIISSEAISMLSDGTGITIPAENIGSDRLGFTFVNEAAKGKVSISLRLQANMNTNIADVNCIPISPVTQSPTMSPLQPSPVPTSSCVICQDNLTKKMKKKGFQCSEKVTAIKKNARRIKLGEIKKFVNLVAIMLVLGMKETFVAMLTM